MTQLSLNFSLEEMVRSQTALRKGIDNTPSLLVIEHLKHLAAELLEPVRAELGVPLHTDSGYRSMLLNDAVGGSPTSVHPLGLAADEIPIGMDLAEAFARIRARKDLPIDQLIIECNTWLHIGAARPGETPRREFMTASGWPGNWHYTKVS
jgi:zinc D-Ala-D-Ala carboxypeptidase